MADYSLTRDVDYHPSEAVRDMPDMPNLHGLLEDINDIDKQIAGLLKKKADYIGHYHTEKDKLDAHYEMVVNRPFDPGPTAGHPGRY